jgi:hypothetical protein
MSQSKAEDQKRSIFKLGCNRDFEEVIFILECHIIFIKLKIEY